MTIHSTKPKLGMDTDFDLSSRSDLETVNRVFAVEADDYIPKPIVPEELLIRVTNRLQRQRSLPRINECR